MSKHECPKCGYKTTQPLLNTRVAHPCPNVRGNTLTWLNVIPAHELVAAA